MSSGKWPRPSLTVDVAVLAGTPTTTRILLVERAQAPFAGAWALPGGFVDEGERVEIAARRELAEETGLLEARSPLRLLGVYDTPGRDPRGWTVSVVYTLIMPAAVTVRGGDDAAQARWFDLDALPPLAFDHALIVADAVLAPR